MFIERELFEKKMQYIIKRLDKIDKTLVSMAKQRCYLDGELLYDNYDLCKLLNISKRTLQRYRSSGELPYYTLYQKTFYKESDVSNFIRLNFGKDKGNDSDNLEEEIVDSLLILVDLVCSLFFFLGFYILSLRPVLL